MWTVVCGLGLMGLFIICTNCLKDKEHHCTSCGKQVGYHDVWCCA